MPAGPENTFGKVSMLFVKLLPSWLSKLPAKILVNRDGATTKAPVPGHKMRLTDQTPFENMEFVSKDKVFGFHKETIVPSGAAGPPGTPAGRNKMLRELLLTTNGALNR